MSFLPNGVGVKKVTYDNQRDLSMLFCRTCPSYRPSRHRTVSLSHFSSRMTLPEGPRLLFDILLQVVHYLDPNHDISTLRSLSISCHTLCAPCQRQLFSSITIRESSDKQNEGLHNLLLKSPHLGSYIRYLDYSYINCQREPFLAGLLNQLPVANIEVLKLSSENRNLYGFYDRDLPRALVRTFRSPHATIATAGIEQHTVVHHRYA